MATLAAIARRHIVETYPELCVQIDRCADSVVDGWDRARVTDPAAVTDPFECCLEAGGINDRLVTVLTTTAETLGYELPATPVPAPPYVIVTSRGPVLRASLPVGRLVVGFDAFGLTAENEYTRGRRGTDMVSVAIRSTA